MKKRYLLAAFAATLCCMALLLRPALAEDEIKASVTASPDKMSEAGQVTFTFEISNYSEYQISGISITDFNGTSHEVVLGVDKFVQPNGSVKTELTLNVPEGKLGTPLAFRITCIRSGEPVDVEAQITIERASEPVITVERTTSATMVREGDSVTVTYTLKNQTRFDMTDITMIDEQVSDTPILKEQLLRANDSISRTTTIQMGEDDMTSAPVVTYTVNGKAKSFSGLEGITMQTVLVKLAMKIDAGLPTATGVVFTIEVKNAGNQEVRDISITDERNNPVNEGTFSLKAEESNTFSYTVVPLMTEAVRNVGFQLKGTDALGQAYTLSAQDTYDVYPFVDESQISVTMQAETVTPWTSDTGKLVMRVTIHNASQVELRNVAVSESMLGVIKTYDVLLAGETTFDQEVLLGSPRNLQFTIKGNDPAGVSRELAIGTLPVAYGTEETAPLEATPVPQNNTNAFAFLSTTIAKILLGLGILMVVAFIVLITLSIAERSAGGKRMRLMEDVDEEDDQDENDAFFATDDRDDDPYIPRETGRAYDTKRDRIPRESRYGDAYREPYAPSSPEEEPINPRAARYAPGGGYGTERGAYTRREPQITVEYEEAPAELSAPPILLAPADEPTTAARGRTGDDYRTGAVHAPSRHAWDEREEEDGEPGAPRTPKVINHKPQPAPQSVRRNTVQHVRKAPKGK